LAGARPLCERALAIHEKVLGPEHPYTATSLNNLAGLLQEQGDLVKARSLFERALAIVLGPEHPHTVYNLNSFAKLFQDQGHLVRARLLYERALAIREKVLGPGHPDTATSLNDLAGLLQDQGDLGRAQPLRYKRGEAVDIETRHAGDREVGALLLTTGHRTRPASAVGRVIKLRKAYRSTCLRGLFGAAYIKHGEPCGERMA
jgi:tetratricopeptide (TPR) repeat protein